MTRNARRFLFCFKKARTGRVLVDDGAFRFMSRLESISVHEIIINLVPAPKRVCPDNAKSENADADR